jgi:hypothetical protein
MTARSPGVSAFLSRDLLGEVLLEDGGQQQQQAPVAAEKQRRVMHACMSFLLRWRSVRISRLWLEEQFRCVEYRAFSANGQ